MDVFITDDYYRFVYDPWLYGYNTAYWRGLNGKPIVNASQQIQLNNATIVSKHQYFRGDFVINLTIPTAPTAGDNREFGMDIPAETTKNSAYFQIQGTSFFGVVQDSINGTTTRTANFTWQAGWTATPQDYRILWNGREVRFYVGTTFLGSVDDRNLVPQLTTVPILLANSNNDNMTLNYMNVSNVHKVVMPSWETTDVEPDNIFRIPGATDATATSENLTIMVDENPNVTDSTATSESIAMTPEQNPNIHDSTSTSESIAVNKYYPISVVDSTTTSESVTVTHS